MAEIIRVDGSREKIEKEKLTLEFMQQIVDGWIEIVGFPNGQALVCNEEGKLRNLPINKTATEIWKFHYGNTDVIAGDIILAEPGEIE